MGPPLRRPARPPSDPALGAAFLRAEREGLRLVVVSRTLVMAAVGTWLMLEFPQVEVLWTLGLVAAFAALGLLPWWQIQRHPRRRWLLFAFALADVLVVAAAVLVPNPLLAHPPPLPLLLRTGGFVYFFLLIAMTGLMTSPALTLWTGLCAAAAWLGATEWIAQSQGAFRLSDLPVAPEVGSPDALRAYLRPEFVDILQSRQNAVVALLVAGVVAAIVARARGLVVRQAELAAQRAVLARYFSPNLLEDIGRHGGSLTEARAVDAAVLFTDVRGFTALAERLSPEQTLALLREVHGHIAQAVFRHDGTLDKFTGDGAMALFGAPRPSAQDALQALQAARDLLVSLHAWNALRRASGQPEVQVGIGLHWGRVITGNVGDARRLDFTAIGDTVNVAARLEPLSRELDADVVASVAFCDRAAAAGAPVADLVDVGTRVVRGRGEPVALRVLQRTLAPVREVPGGISPPG